MVASFYIIAITVSPTINIKFVLVNDRIVFVHALRKLELRSWVEVIRSYTEANNYSIFHTYEAFLILFEFCGTANRFELSKFELLQDFNSMIESDSRSQKLTKLLFVDD